MYSLDTLTTECVGRYITTPRGHLRLTNLINGRTYADCWASLLQWSSRQHSLQNSFSIAPIGVLVQDRSGVGESRFLFFRSYVNKYGFLIRPEDVIEEDDATVAVKMYVSALSKYSGSSAQTIKTALAHMFQRLGEVIASRQKTIVDFGFATLVAEDCRVEMIINGQREKVRVKNVVASNEQLKQLALKRRLQSRFRYLGAKRLDKAIPDVLLNLLKKSLDGESENTHDFAALLNGDLSNRIPSSSPERMALRGSSPSPPPRGESTSMSTFYPPVLDRFSRTYSASFSESSCLASISSRVASFYSPNMQCYLIKKGRVFKTASKHVMVDAQNAAKRTLHTITIGAAAFNKKDDNTRNEGGLTNVTDAQRSLDRFQYYLNGGIRQEMVAPIKQIWVKNVLSLLSTDFSMLNNEKVDEIVRASLDEMNASYNQSGRRVILDYVLRDPVERSRLLITAPPSRYVRDWGSCSPQKAPPTEWRRPIQQSWIFLNENLFPVNQTSVAMLQIWDRYKHFSLVTIPDDIDLPMSMQDFGDLQQTHIKAVRDMFCNDWMKEIEDVYMAYIDKHNMEEQKSKQFFESVATLMKNLLRQIVERSALELHAFFARFRDLPTLRFVGDKQDALSILQSEPGSSNDVPMSPLKLKMLMNRRKMMFEMPLEEIKSVIVQTFDNVLCALDSFPRVENKIFPLLENTSHLSLEINDDVFNRLRLEIIATFNTSSMMSATMLEMYEKLSYLFDEHQHISEFLEETRPLSAYREKIELYRALSTKIESNLNNTIYCQIIALDTKKLNEMLVMRANELSQQILVHIKSRSITRNIAICDEFQSISTSLLKRPTDSKELNEIVEYAKRFREHELQRLLDECKRASDEVLFLFDCDHLVDEETLTHTGSSFSWIKKIANTIKETENSLTVERRKMESQLEDRRDKLLALLGNYAQLVKDFAEFSDMERALEYNLSIRNVKSNLDEAQQEVDCIHEQEKLLGLTHTDFHQLENACIELEPFEELWLLVNQYRDTNVAWKNGPVFSLDSQKVSEQCSTMKRDATQLFGQFSNTSSSVPAGVCSLIRSGLEEFASHLNLVEVLCNKGMRERHWESVSEIVGFDLRPDTHTSLSRFVEMGVANFIEKLNVISESASKQFSIERAMTSMHEEWIEVELATTPYRESGTHIILAAVVEEIQQILDDQIVKTQTMKGASAAKPFQKEISEWEVWLTQLQDIITAWLKVQLSWLYLEPIFSSADILKQMPEEGTMFQVVDKDWRCLMSQVLSNPKVQSVTKIDKLFDTLKDAQIMLDNIQKGLSQYLETKRLFFPRFFFLSNDELLEILAETKDPTKVQPHLKKCFEGINRLEFKDNLDITAMISPEGERVQMTTVMNPKNAKGAVESWLSEVENNMFSSVRKTIEESMNAYSVSEREKWVLEWPGQVVLAVSQVYWTQHVAHAINSDDKNALQDYLDTSNERLRSIVDLVRGQLTRLERKTLGSLVVLDVHARDTLVQLVESNINDTHSFEWMSQLRYYWEDDTVRVRIITSEMQYGYEYLGNSSRLVITPLTDRCYRTLMGAIQFNLGGAPEGPAGTGKTETVKDLAKAVAIQCVVFNCSDGLDFLAMGKFFKGLASSGAWACFDEFNRIDLEVLSVVAQQVLSIQRAVAAKVNHFSFEGTDIRLKCTCNVFITMNPGYAGRAELPDNLKALFRTVAMMVPDYAMIAEILLYSFGFVEARQLARKIVATYRLCSEQLSSQDHYDYGMRAVKAVLTAAGNFKRAQPDAKENVVMLRAITDVNLPKFLSHDIPLFEGIVADLFPGTTLSSTENEDLLDAIDSNIAKLGLQAVPAFVEKVLQLYETAKVRHGFMVVGLSFAGKSSALKVLSGALSDVAAKNSLENKRMQVITINPKSITLGQLYGQFDGVTHEWQDGILSIHYRSLASSESLDRKWLVFDGPVDAIWIENMNTVLDDNRKLCLMSGEIIQMSDSMNMIFETADLSVASPATVSRCGMVYMEPKRLGWTPLLQSWLAVLPDERWTVEQKELLSAYCLWALPPLLEFVYRHCSSYVPVSSISLADSFMRLFEALLVSVDLNQLDAKGRQLRVEASILFALVWSLGAAIDAEGRLQFTKFLHELCSQNIPTANGASFQLLASFPQTGTVFDYVWDTNVVKWCTWASTLERNFRIAPDAAVHEILIPTVDTASVTYVLDVLVKRRYHTLFVGPTGTGKSALIAGYLHRQLLAKNEAEGESNKLSSAHDNALMSFTINFSARTSALQTQQLIDSRIERRRKGVFGPLQQKHAVIFVDDLNMPEREVYGAQPPLELLRSLIDHGGWYDLDGEASFRSIVDVQIVAAMGLPGGGRNPISDRTLRHFSLLSVTAVGDESLGTIFGAILNWHFATQTSCSPPFNSEIIKLIPKLVNATASLYATAVKELLPTPEKSHYTFNLRDFARVIRGLCLSHPDEMSTSESVVRLWVHEVHRVFSDRLVNDIDAANFLGWVRETCSNHIGVNFDKVMRRLDVDEDGDVDTVEEVRHLFFGNYMKRVGARRPYVEIEDLVNLREVFNTFLGNYNAISNSQMKLVLFRFALEHVSRISRVILQPGGHALLVGVGGSGRASLTRLAAHVSDCKVFGVELSKGYGVVEWRDDLKRILRSAGEKMQKTVFLFSDTQIKDASFIEDINAILNSGDVPNLFAAEDWAEMGENLRAAAKRRKRDNNGAPEQLKSFFNDMVRENLHVVLCMSPVGDAFRERLRMFPSLVNCCTIDWFQPWPHTALETVANEFLEEVEMNEADRNVCVKMCVHFHSSTNELATRFLAELRRHYYVTPTSYLELITSFKTLLKEKREEITQRKQRYEGGLRKLASTAEQVKTMQAELEELRPVLIQTGKETDEMIVKVDKETKEAEVIRQGVKKEEAIANTKAHEAKTIQDDCEAELAEAMPILEAAISALNTLTRNDLVEVKAMKSPPDGVRIVMEAVCIMMNVAPVRVPDPKNAGKTIKDYWDPAKKKLLSDPKLLNALSTYDKDNIQPDVIKKITTYMDDPLFDPIVIKKASKAAYGLCCWVRAMHSYDRVAKIVQPKRESLGQAKEEYKIVKQGLDAKQAELAVVELKLSDLNCTLHDMQEKKCELEHNVDLCGKKLVRAQQLLGGLGGERDRWTTAATALGEQYDRLTGDVLISAGLVAYLGAFTAAFRSAAVREWSEKCALLGMACSEEFRLSHALGDPILIRKWVSCGLPNDSFSIENAIVVAKARRWPLLIDPQAQANKWIKRLEGDKLVVVKLSDTDTLRKIEGGVQFGVPCLLENVGEEIDPTLEPLLLKQIYRRGGVDVIKLGDNEIEYSPSFRLYVTTKLRNPHYLPELSTKVTLLNFMITPEGLEDQLLGIVVEKERPELQEEKNRLIVQSADNRERLQGIEEEILHVLSSSEGNILDDEHAIQVLSASKELANDIADKQQIADETEKQIDSARMGYQPVAFHSSILFFCIADLANIDPMYQYSLEWFINLFGKAIDKSERSDVLESRLKSLNEYFTYNLFCAICRSLFERDKLLFSLLLCVNIMRGAGSIDATEWRFFLTGGVSIDQEIPPNPASEWLVNQAWTDICSLSRIESFEGMKQSFSELVDEWQKVYDSMEPHNEDLPGKWQTCLSPFQKLLILRCLRPDKIIPAVRNFVAERLGQSFVEAPPFDLESAFKDSSPTIPLVFVLSAGSDPMASLLKFANDVGFEKRLESISLGQGQGILAQKMIESAQARGSWIVLQNCHLSVSWMPTLERICEQTSISSVHRDYRLWVTSYPSDKFPVSMLQNGVKMTKESPQGLRANLLGSYSRDPISESDFYTSCSLQHEFTSLLYGLCLFHAVIQERRNFGALGWNIPYEFNESDLRISVRQVHLFVNDANKDDLPYDALKYLIGQCNYGGRVTEDWDRRTLLTLLNRVFRPEILEENFSFSSSGNYLVPKDGSHSSCVEHIRELPMLARPEVFGLHDNADISKDQSETMLLFNSILLTQARTNASGNNTKESILCEVAADVLRKIPTEFDLELANKKYPVLYEDSMNTVLCQELIRYNRLVSVIRSSLKSLEKALVGLVVMSSELESVGSAMFDGRVPEAWLAVSYPTLKPLAGYVSDLQQRLKVLADWITYGAPNVFWISGFFFTQSFLTGVLQNYARGNHIPIDEISFDFEWINLEPNDPSIVKPADGAYVHGLFLQGARWDAETQMLAESKPKVLFSNAPIIWLRPRRTSEISVGNSYECPVYKTSERRGTLSTTGHSTNYVMAIQVPNDRDDAHWILRGVALITQLDV